MDKSIHIVCGHCDAINRLPQGKLKLQPVCGKCKLALFDGYPIALTHHNFDAHITRNDTPVLVDFWAPWCGPCLSMAQAYEMAAKQLAPDIRVAKLNTEIEQSIAARYAIRSIPTLIMFRNGKEVARQAGAMDLSGIVSWAKRQA